MIFFLEQKFALSFQRDLDTADGDRLVILQMGGGYG